MIAKNKIINLISAAFFLGLNFLFIIKYSSRYSAHYIAAAFGFLITQGAILYVIDKYTPELHKLTIKTKLYALSVPLLAIYSILFYFAPASTRVSRAAAVNSWLGDLLNGVFPYGSQANPSGFPFNFFLQLPFYLAGDAGLLQVITLTGSLLLLVYFSKTLKELFFRGFLFISCVPLVYELIVKSELFSVMSLAAALAVYTLKKVEDEKLSVSFFISAAFSGLLLSTRLTLIPVLLILVLFKFRNSFKSAGIYLLTASLTFTATLIPFILWDSTLFFSRGPFAVQSLYLHPVFMALIIILSAYTGWAAANKYEMFFGIGLTVLTAVIISFFSTVFEEGFYGALFSDRFDISYFIFSVPFFLLGMYEYRVDYFLGKVMPFEESV